MSDDDRSTVDRLTIEATYVFEPLLEAAAALSRGDRVPLYRLCESLGIDVDDDGIESQLGAIEETVEGLESVYEAVEGVLAALDSGPFTDASATADSAALDVAELRSVPDAITDIVGGIRDLDELSISTPEAEIESVGTALLDFLLVDYLRRRHPAVADVLELIDVIDRDGPVARVDLSMLPAALENPQAHLAATVGWGAGELAEQFEPVSLLYYVRFVAWEFGRWSSVGPPDADVIDVLDDETVGVEGYDPTQQPDLLDVRLLTLPIGDGTRTSAGLRFVPVAREDAPQGLAILPYGTLESGFERDLGEGWRAFFDSSGGFEEWGVVAFPDAQPGPFGDAAGSFHGELGVARDGDADELTLLGDDGGSRLALTSIEARAVVRYDGEDVRFGVELPVTGTLAVDPGGFDGFLSAVLPDDGIRYEFSIVVGWSSKAGLYFEQGGTLEASIPQNARLGPVEMREIHVAALPGGVEEDDDPSLTLSAAASASVELGPIVGTVQRMGIRANLAFPADRDGSLGPVDLDIGFDPPDGIGLAIDAEGVTGGGYLEFDHENERYAGAVQLHVGELTFNAVGLLTTRMPDGSDGFSLLLLITAEFPPIELGLGFTLNGLGGLVGIHRGVKTDPLKRAVRDGSLDSVLFPENVVENAPRIVSDLRETFPPTADTHVFGPMARLGWGTPTLITADLGVLLELPSARIVVLGRIAAVLPDDAAPLVELNAGVLGEIDPAIPELEMHASLYDSRVVAWDLSGDFGVRLRGGDEPDFLLSAGGFHPQYEPPRTFQDMRRLRASLGDPGGNPSLDLKGYFAVTSNTVQAGANCSFYAGLGPASVDGELGFDALVQFDPFEFVVDALASLTVKALGTTFSVSLDGTLSGPAPWHVDGKVEVGVAFVSVTVHVDVTFGSEDDRGPLPPVDVLERLAAALERPGNWSTGRPAAGDSPVVLRDPDGGDGSADEGDEEAAPALSLHPLSEPAVRQTVVPLDVEIERFGNATPADATRFEIADATAEGGSTLSVGGATTEKFAPGEYFDLSDDERLDSPAFESMDAGRRLVTGGVYAGQAAGDDEATLADNARRTALAYETSIRDERRDNYDVPLASIEGIDIAASGISGSVAQRLTRASIGRETLGCDVGPSPSELLDEGTTPSEAALEGAFGGGSGDRRYRIVRSDTFEPVDLDGREGDDYTKAEAKRTIERCAADGANGRYQVVAADQLD